MTTRVKIVEFLNGDAYITRSMSWTHLELVNLKFGRYVYKIFDEVSNSPSLTAEAHAVPVYTNPSEGSDICILELTKYLFRCKWVKTNGALTTVLDENIRAPLLESQISPLRAAM